MVSWLVFICQRGELDVLPVAMTREEYFIDWIRLLPGSSNLMSTVRVSGSRPTALPSTKVYWSGWYSLKASAIGRNILLDGMSSLLTR